MGEIRLNHEQTLINGKLFVNRNLVAEKVLAFNQTMHFISQDQIYIESNSGVSGNIGRIHIGNNSSNCDFYTPGHDFILKKLTMII